VLGADLNGNLLAGSVIETAPTSRHRFFWYRRWHFDAGAIAAINGTDPLTDDLRRVDVAIATHMGMAF